MKTDEEIISAFEAELREIALRYGRDFAFDGASEISELAKAQGRSVQEVIDELRPMMIAQTNKFASGALDHQLTNVGGVKTPVLRTVKGGKSDA